MRVFQTGVLLSRGAPTQAGREFRKQAARSADFSPIVLHGSSYCQKPPGDGHSIRVLWHPTLDDSKQKQPVLVLFLTEPGAACSRPTGPGYDTRDCRSIPRAAPSIQQHVGVTCNGGSFQGEWYAVPSCLKCGGTLREYQTVATRSVLFLAPSSRGESPGAVR